MPGRSPVTDPTRRIPLRRKLLYGALTGSMAAATFVLAGRLYFTRMDAATPDTTDTTIPGPGAVLRVRCTVFGPEACGRHWGVPLNRCFVPGCQTAEGFTTTPQGLLGPIDRIYGLPKPGDTYRILALGGSTTGGWIWHLRWPAKLERLLNEAAQAAGKRTRFEVLNAAAQGGTSQDSREFFEWRAAALDLDAVILGEEVNDVLSCNVFQASLSPRDGRGGDEVVRDYLEGNGSLDEVEALSPWHARHRDDFVAAREREARQHFIAAARAAVRPDRDVWKQSPRWREECLRDEPKPRALGPSILDDFDVGWRYTRERFDAILDLTRARGIQLAVVTTVPHDFDRFRCPTPACASVFSLDDWQAYIDRVHNPAIRAYGRERGVALVDLERDVDDFAAGHNTVSASLERVLGDYADEHGLSRPSLAERFERGEVGKAPLFEEWMHPTPPGHELVAAAYFAAIWPRISAELR